MTTWIVIAACALAGIWLVETVLFVLSYRGSRRMSEPEREAKAPL
jgi:hypothetical protein